MRGHLIGRRELLAAALVAAAPAAARAAELVTARTEAGREVDLRIWAPKGRPLGVMTFSTGAFSSPWKYRALIEAWVRDGWLLVAPLHVDSTNHPQRARYDQAAGFITRFEDVRLAAAEGLRRAAGAPLVATGHSYGALVALILGGARATPGGQPTPDLRDPRVRAVIAFSPPGFLKGYLDPGAFSTLSVPAFVQTGDKDVLPGFVDDWRAHLAAYETSPTGDKYGLVLEGVDHYFGGVIGRPELPGPKQSARFDEAAALSTLFARAYGRGDVRARRSLQARLSDSGPVRLARR